jgi:hypothetical protein
LLLAGVEHDGITFKDWFATLKMLRPGRLHEQVGFKLNALMEGRLRRPMATEYLFGDDVESDATAFSIYSKLVNGDLPPGELEAELEQAGVKPDDRRFIHDLQSQLPAEHGRVKRFFIHLELNSPPDRFAHLGERAAPVKGGFQLSLSLYSLGLLDRDAVEGAAEAVEDSHIAISKYGRPAEQAADALDRGLIPQAKLTELGY